MFVDVLWPEFRREHLYTCLEQYARARAPLRADVGAACRRSGRVVSCAALALGNLAQRFLVAVVAVPILLLVLYYHRPEPTWAAGLRRVAARDARVLRDDAAGRGSLGPRSCGRDRVRRVLLARSLVRRSTWAPGALRRVARGRPRLVARVRRRSCRGSTTCSVSRHPDGRAAVRRDDRRASSTPAS